MPTYEYRCGGCGHEFEEFQSITAKPLKKCPACAESRLQRLIGTGAGILFKGEGFYQTDYRSESYKNAAKAESGGDSAKSEQSKGDSKDAPSKAPEKKPSGADKTGDSSGGKSKATAAAAS
jgi:putative FmdB family regulatory protein